jgi:4-hydroxy-tetrahydrodipicolinate synthase
LKPLKSENIRGNWATLLLPVNSDQSIDFHCLSEEIDILIESSPNGIYSNGTTGEFYNQTEEEFDKISEMLADKCNNAGVAFQLGVSHMSPLLSYKRLERVTRLTPGAVQVILPDWCVPTLDESADFLCEMARQAGSIGIVLYNPPHAKKVLSPADIGFLKSEVPQLVGVKVADGDSEWYEGMSTHCSGLSVFVPGHNLATGIKLGADGSYSNMACLNPKAAQKWYEMMDSDIEGAIELEKRIHIFMKDLIVPFATRGYSNIALDKFMAAVGKWSGVSSRLRWPYHWIETEYADQVRKKAYNIIPEFLTNS